MVALGLWPLKQAIQGDFKPGWDLRGRTFTQYNQYNLMTSCPPTSVGGHPLNTIKTITTQLKITINKSRLEETRSINQFRLGRRPGSRPPFRGLYRLENSREPNMENSGGKDPPLFQYHNGALVFCGTGCSRSKKGGVRRGKELPGKGYYPGITLEERIRMKKRTKARMSNIRLRALTGRQEA